jgi:hypothetical protein
MFLHAQSLQFIKPGTTEQFTITAPLSDELQMVLKKLEEATGKKGRAS